MTLNVVDAQIHVWERGAALRRWPAWGEAQAGHHRPAGPFTVDQALEEMSQAGVSEAILIPPSFVGDNNETVLDAAARYPDRFRVMARVSLQGELSEAELRSRLQAPQVLGFRLTFVQGSSRAWLTDGTAEWFWRAAEALGIPVMVFAPGQTVELGRVASRYGGLRMVVDHLGIPTGTLESDVVRVVDPLCVLAKFGNVAVKASALPCFTREGYPFPSLHGVIRRVVDAFGPRRVFWGSDLSRLPCTYSQSVELFTETGVLSSAEQEWVMGRGLKEWVGWSETSAAARPHKRQRD